MYARSAPPAPRRLYGAALVASLLATGCTAVVGHSNACSNNAECRAGFGLGSVCQMDGYCSPVQTNLRCSRTYPMDLLTNRTRYRDYIVLGSIFKYTDDNFAIRAGELAVRQVNANGGLQGRMFGIVHCDYAESTTYDTLTEPQAAAQTAQYLANTIGVPGILGVSTSSLSIEAFNAIHGQGVVMLSPEATSPALTPLDNTSPTDATPGMFWRDIPSDAFQATVIVQDMRSRNIQRAAVIYQRGAYGEALAGLFQTGFTAMGGTISAALPFADGQLGDAIAQVGTSNAEEVLFISSDTPDFPAFLGAIGQPSLIDQWRTRNFFFPDAAYTQSLIDTTTEPVRAAFFPHLRGTRPAPANGTQLYNAFAADFNLEYGASADSDAYTAYAYDAGWMMLYGVAWSYFRNNNAVTGQGIAQGFRRLSAGTHVDVRPSNWLTVVDSFRAGRSVDIQGASGTLDFDPTTEETAGPIEVWRIMSGSMWTLTADHTVSP